MIRDEIRLRVDCSSSSDIDRAGVLDIVGRWCLGNRGMLDGRLRLELVLFGV